MNYPNNIISGLNINSFVCFFCKKFKSIGEPLHLNEKDSRWICCDCVRERRLR